MILTAIVAGADGMDFTVARAADGLASMFGEQLRSQGDTFEVLDVDEMTLLQRGRTRLLHRGEVLDTGGRVYALSPVSTCPLRERKLANIYHVLLERGLPLLNRSFAANPELEVNKTVMQAFVADLGIPCVPTMDLNAYMTTADLLASSTALGFGFPLVLKPNRLSFGVGILTCDSQQDFVVKARMIQQLKADYLIQQFIPHAGDLRVFLSRDAILGHGLRQPMVAGEFRSNVAVGGQWTPIALPARLEEWCLHIASRCDADYIVLDWLVSGSSFLFNEMCSALGGFSGVSPDVKARLASVVVGIAREKLARAEQAGG